MSTITTVGKDQLPKLTRHEMQKFALRDDGQHANSFPGGLGVSFERIQPNGDVEWRLRGEGNTLLVNCLKYTRWQEIWPFASELMRGAVEIVGADKLVIAGNLLQYVDVFDWVGPEDEYDVFQLLDWESEYVPRSVHSYGHVWHIHQGWFTPVERPVPGRLLQKAHFDAGPRTKNGRLTVKLDTHLRTDFGDHISASTFQNEVSPLEASFMEMHDRNKSVIRSFLTKKVCVDIGLGEDG